MNFRTWRRSLGNLLAITRNRVMGRTFVPVPRRTMVIETSQRCNLACRFCAYADVGPGVFMAESLFRRTVDEIAEMGVRDIWLTPMLGELFADPAWPQRLDALQAHGGIDSFGFYSNFILPREDDIRRLASYEKLNAIHISIYGHDAETFTRVTRKPARQFDKLMVNLRALAEAATPGRFPGGIHFNVRTVDGLTRDALPRTALVETLDAFERDKRARITVAGEYDSWGGTISQRDVDPLGIALTDGRAIHMHGACILLFSSPQVRADGTVQACACRDVDGSLRLGHMNDAPLAELTSSDNPAFRAIVDAQQHGRFGPNCRSCAMYRSIYDDRPSRHDPALPVMSLDAALARMR